MIALSEKQQFLEDEVVDKEVEKKKFMKIQLSKLKRLLKRLMNEWKPAPSPFHATMHLAQRTMAKFDPIIFDRAAFTLHYQQEKRLLLSCVCLAYDINNRQSRDDESLICFFFKLAWLSRKLFSRRKFHFHQMM